MADASCDSADLISGQYLPERWQKKIAVIHEGVSESMLKDLDWQLAISETVTLEPDIPAVTFIS